MAPCCMLNGERTIVVYERDPLPDASAAAKESRPARLANAIRGNCMLNGFGIQGNAWSS